MKNVDENQQANRLKSMKSWKKIVEDQEVNTNEVMKINTVIHEK